MFVLMARTYLPDNRAAVGATAGGRMGGACRIDEIVEFRNRCRSLANEPLMSENPSDGLYRHSALRWKCLLGETDRRETAAHCECNEIAWNAILSTSPDLRATGAIHRARDLRLRKARLECDAVACTQVMADLLESLSAGSARPTIFAHSFRDRPAYSSEFPRVHSK